MSSCGSDESSSAESLAAEDVTTAAQDSSAAETADSTVMMFGGECATHLPTAELLSGNELYTTAAARIAGTTFAGAVTAEQLIDLCGKAGGAS